MSKEEYGPSAGDSRIKYADIPEPVRKGARIYVRLLKAGKPIPDHIRKLHNEYKSWARRKGKNPADFKGNIIHDYIPEPLRKANTEVARLRRLGEKPDEKVAADYLEYQRWLKYKGEPPKRMKLEPVEPKWPLTAVIEYDRLIKEGVAPGDIPRHIVEGRAEHLGVKPSKFTKCALSDRVGGRGCRGRHGNGPRRLRYVPGVAMCVRCTIAYTGVPEDVNRCGCCGATLRKEKRFKS